MIYDFRLNSLPALPCSLYKQRESWNTHRFRETFHSKFYILNSTFSSRHKQEFPSSLAWLLLVRRNPNNSLHGTTFFKEGVVCFHGGKHFGEITDDQCDLLDLFLLP